MIEPFFLFCTCYTLGHMAWWAISRFFANCRSAPPSPIPAICIPGTYICKPLPELRRLVPCDE